MGWVPAGPAPPQAATTSSEKGPRLPLKATGLEAQALRQGNLSGPWPREKNLVLGEDRGTRAQGRAALAPGSPFGSGRLLQVAGRSYFLGLIKPGDPRSRGQGPSVGGRLGSALQYPQWGRSQHALLQGGGLGAHACSSEGEPARRPRCTFGRSPPVTQPPLGDGTWPGRADQSKVTGTRHARQEAGPQRSHCRSPVSGVPTSCRGVEGIMCRSPGARVPRGVGRAAPSPCWPGSGGSSSHARGSRAQSSCTPPRSKHRARLQPGVRGVSSSQDGVAAEGGQAGRALTSDDLHVEPQPPQGLLRIEAALYQLVQCLGEQEPLPTCSPLGTSSVHTTSRRGHRGCSHHPQVGTVGVHPAQHPAYLLTVFHRLPHRELRAGHLMPPPLDCAVQELLHLPLREDVGVPEQLVFVLIHCVAGGQGQLGPVIHTWPREQTGPPHASARLAGPAPEDGC